MGDSEPGYTAVSQAPFRTKATKGFPAPGDENEQVTRRLRSPERSSSLAPWFPPWIWKQGNREG